MEAKNHPIGKENPSEPNLHGFNMFNMFIIQGVRPVASCKCHHEHNSLQGPELHTRERTMRQATAPNKTWHDQTSSHTLHTLPWKKRPTTLRKLMELRAVFF